MHLTYVFNYSLDSTINLLGLIESHVYTNHQWLRQSLGVVYWLQ